MYSAILVNIPPEVLSFLFLEFINLKPKYLRSEERRVVKECH